MKRFNAPIEWHVVGQILTSGADSVVYVGPLTPREIAQGRGALHQYGVQTKRSFFEDTGWVYRLTLRRARR